MLGRIVYCDTGWQTVAAIQDLLEIKLGAAQAGFVLGWKILQSSIETTTTIPKYRVTLKRASGSYTPAAGGGAATITKGQTADPAHGLATLTRNNPTQALVATGALDAIDADIMNESSGALEVAYIPEAWKPIGPAEAAILSIEEAPASQSLRAILTLLLTHG